VRGHANLREFLAPLDLAGSTGICFLEKLFHSGNTSNRTHHDVLLKKGSRA